MENVLAVLKSLLTPGGILIAVILLLYLNSWTFRNLKAVKSTGNVIKISISFFLILFGALIFILSLPIDQDSKEQILGFLGIVISAGIALSSTTVLGNLIAGIMNNLMDRFKNGDLITLGDLEGRVIKKSIFHSEIQLEDSNYVTIPNLYIATNPVKLTRKTNTVISCSVSLGYDVSRQKIEEALKAAATSTGLKDPFVYIMDLGDHAVEYKIHGFLDDSTKFFSTTSLLKAKVMDKLHEQGIEIVSPSFRNQRRVEEEKFIPKPGEIKSAQKEEDLIPEELIFDEAIEAGEIEQKRELLKEIETKKENLREDLKNPGRGEDPELIKSAINRLDRLEEKIKTHLKEKREKEGDR